MTDTRVLSCHAAYRCRHAGACCTAGWPIDVEPDRAATIDRALRTATLRARVGTPLLRPDSASSRRVVLAVHDGACAFYGQHGDGRCAIHHRLGHAALPLACRQFPRVVVTDLRGVSITLSHYCPTAAQLLSRAGDPALVVNAPGFAPGEEYVGLDVREGLPPALRPDMLMTWPAWWRWEETVAVRLAAARDPAAAMADVRAGVEVLRRWSPNAGSLDDAVDAALAAAPGSTVPARPSLADVVSGVLRSVPEACRAQAAAALARRTAPPAARVQAAFLAAHAFANWTAHLGEGLRTWFRSLEAAHALVMAGVGIGDVDLVLRHLADPHALARSWGEAEIQA